MGTLTRVNGWLLAVMVLLIVPLAACGEQATAPANMTATPEAQPAEAAAAAPTATAEPPAAQEVTLYVGPEQVDCVGTAPQQCLQVKQSPEGEYQLFYDQIEGFEHEPGYEYELRVRQEPVEDAPADASAVKWTLIEVVNRQEAPVTLEDTSWQLVSYADDQGNPSEVLPDSQITALFQEGQVVGSAGCNSYFGTYTLEGNNLTIEGTGATKMFCAPEALMQQEAAYLDALNAAASYRISGNQLEILNAEGQTTLTFTSAEPAA